MINQTPSSDSLSGLRVMVARPQQQAGKWQAQLEALGAKSYRATLLEIIPFNGEEPNHQAEAEAIKQRVQKLQQYQHVIFVSQNAVMYGCSWIDSQQLPLIGPSYYAVGSATAEALIKKGFPVMSAQGAMNSETLLELPQLQHVTGQRVLIFRGQGGRPRLANELSDRGAEVDYCELYRRELPEETAQQLVNSDWGQANDVVSLHSGESLSNWNTIIDNLNKPQWRELPVLVPGHRVYELAQNLGFSTIITAENATDLSMSRALVEWHGNQETL